LRTLDGENGFRVVGSDFELSGHSVASAGDINGDGFDDIIVGAPATDPYGNALGNSYVVFGQAKGFGARIDLADLDGSNGFKLVGESRGDKTGQAVASAGDVNGDGLADLIVGAMGADPHGTESGASYVVFGREPDAAVTRAGTDASQNLVGGSFDDALNGRGGDDHLFGHAGNDVLRGGDGADRVIGGAGTDKLIRGSGNDTFVFAALSDSPGDGTRDHIVDFAAGDRIDLTGIETQTGVDLSFVGAAAFSHTAGELRQVTSAGGTATVVLGDTNGDGRADFQIVLPGHHTLSAGDFIL
jgi:Ca2+-binding RTX toxin-like protein